MPYHDTPGVRLFYDLHTGTNHGRSAGTFVLVHGWACNSNDWELIVPALLSHGRVLTVDLRGCGRSAASSPHFFLPDVTADLLSLLDHLDLSDAIIVGHSAGAEVAVTAVVTRPTRFTACVAVDPAYGFSGGDRERIKSVVQRMDEVEPSVVAAEYFTLVEGINTPPELALSHSRTPLQESEATIRGIFRDFAFGPGSLHFRPSTDAALARRRVPLLAFYRNQVRAAVGAEFATARGDVVIVYDGAGHWLHQEEPTRFVGDVTKWLSTLEGTR